MTYKLLGSFWLLLLLFFGCSASVDDRFSRGEDKIESEFSEIEVSKTEIIPNEDFDFSKYATTPDTSLIPIKKYVEKQPTYEDLWFTYDDEPSYKTFRQKKVKGFRVQILSTDNYNQADSLRSIVYFKTNNKNIYIDFESPFYKVKVGDYSDVNSANELGFKLRQLGFSSTLVISDSINILDFND